MFAGDPGLGKSLVTLGMAATISAGGTWPDGTSAKAGAVLLISAEDDLADTIRPRLDAAGADVRRVRALQRSFSLRTDMGMLSSELEQHPDTRLIIIDPISAFLDGTDSHNNAEVRGLLSQLTELASRYRVAVVCVTHLNKGEGSAMYRTTGSLAFVAAARAAYVFAQDRNDPSRRFFLHQKNNLGSDSTGFAYTILTADNDAPVVAWEPEPVTITADEALAAFTNPRARGGAATALGLAVDWLREQVADGPAPADDLKQAAASAGFSWITLRRAKETLGIVSRKLEFDGPWAWMLPADHLRQKPSPATVSVSASGLANVSTVNNGAMHATKDPLLDWPV